jgi:integrase
MTKLCGPAHRAVRRRASFTTFGQLGTFSSGTITGPSLTCSVKVVMCATVPVPDWVKAAVDEWLNVARVEDGLIFRCVTHSGTVWGSGISEKVVWWVVRQRAKKAAIDRVAPHDLRRTCARLCHSAGGELEQIQFLLGHRSVETTERYLGSRQRDRARRKRQAR